MRWTTKPQPSLPDTGYFTIMVKSSPHWCMPRKKRSFVGEPHRLTVTLGRDQRKAVEVIALRNRTSAATVVRWAVDDYAKRGESVDERPVRRNNRKAE